MLSFVLLLYTVEITGLRERWNLGAYIKYSPCKNSCLQILCVVEYFSSLVSSLIDVLGFGFWCKKAASLNPIDAIRYE